MENNILKSVCSKNRFVSSTNIIGSNTEGLGRSLTCNKKITGPSIEPYGTPLLSACFKTMNQNWESKSVVQKTLICSKSREGTSEYSGATRFSNTSVEVQ